jgi:hypothetical protein
VDRDLRRSASLTRRASIRASKPAGDSGRALLRFAGCPAAAALDLGGPLVRAQERHRMPEKMKALVKRSPEPGIWLESVPVPSPGTNEVLVKVEKTAICGTDLHIYKWDEWSQRTIQPPLVIGHEFVGHIVEMGPGVTNYRIGDRVSAEGHITCGECRNCRAGVRHLCTHTRGIGVNRDGAFAEYIVVPAQNLWLIRRRSPHSSTPSATPRTARCPFRWWARTC